MRWNKPFLLLTLAAVIAFVHPAVAQFSATAPDARSGALGGSALFVPGVRQVDIGYRQQFLMPGMADKQLHLQLPTGSLGTAVARYAHNGNADYHEQQLMLGYALRVNEWLHVGVAGRWLHLGTSDPHYRPQQWLAASALLRASLGRSALTFVAGTRPWDEQQRWRLHLQASYRPASSLLTVFELEQEERLRLRMGMEYRLHEMFYFRVGMASHPTLLTFGFGARWQHYSVDLAAEVHSNLGLTPHTTLTLWF